jgi:hypothetical protein
MAIKFSGATTHSSLKKKSSSSGKMSMVKRSSMNKSKKQGFKKYRGQGR